MSKSVQFFLHIFCIIPCFSFYINKFHYNVTSNSLITELILKFFILMIIYNLIFCIHKIIYKITKKEQTVIILQSVLLMDYLLRFFKIKQPKSVKVCALLDKPSRRMVSVPIAYNGFKVPNMFIIGYGLDLAEKYRNLPYIAAVKT